MKRPRVPAYHWQGDGSGVAPLRLDAAGVRRFCARLMAMMDMVPLAAPVVCQVTNDEKVWASGVTYLLPISDSNIAVHTLIKARVVFIDVFSCKPLNRERLQASAERYFGGKWKDRMIIRGRKPWRFW